MSCPPDDFCKKNYTCNEAGQTCKGTNVTHNISWSVGATSGNNFLSCSQTKYFYTETDGCSAGHDWLYECATDSSESFAPPSSPIPRVSRVSRMPDQL